MPLEAPRIPSFRNERGVVERAIFFSRESEAHLSEKLQEALQVAREEVVKSQNANNRIRNRKLNVGAALLHKINGGEVGIVPGHNTKKQHAEERVFRSLLDAHFLLSVPKDKSKILGMALSAHSSHTEEPRALDDLNSRDLPPSSPAMCNQCIDLLVRLCRDMFSHERRTEMDFPIVVDLSDGNIMMTTYKNITPVIFPGTPTAKGLRAKTKSK